MCELERGQHYRGISAETSMSWSNILPLESKMVLGFQPVSSYKLIRLQTLKKFNTHHLNLEFTHLSAVWQVVGHKTK